MTLLGDGSIVDINKNGKNVPDTFYPTTRINNIKNNRFYF